MFQGEKKQRLLGSSDWANSLPVEEQTEYIYTVCLSYMTLLNTFSSYCWKTAIFHKIIEPFLILVIRSSAKLVHGVKCYIFARLIQKKNP